MERTEWNGGKVVKAGFMSRIALYILASFALLFLPHPARAACSNPAGNEKDMIYNGDYHTYQFCNGISWMKMPGGVGAKGAMTQISTQNVSAGSSIQFTGLGSSYYYFKLLCTDVITSSSSADLQLQFGEGGAPAWETSNYVSANDYEYADGGGGGHTGGGWQTGDTGIDLNKNTSGTVYAVTAAPNSETVDLTLTNLGSSTMYKNAQGLTAVNYSGSFHADNIYGSYNGDSNPVTAIRLIPSTGTVTGRCNLYGMN
jgi:hypothetical protein